MTSFLMNLFEEMQSKEVFLAGAKGCTINEKSFAKLLKTWTLGVGGWQTIVSQLKHANV